MVGALAHHQLQRSARPTVYPSEFSFDAIVDYHLSHTLSPPPPPTGQPPTARLGEEREAQCATGLRARWPPNLTSTRAIRHVLLIRSDNVPPSPAGHRQCGRHSVVVIMSAKRKMGSIPKVSRNCPLSHLFTAEPVLGVVLTSLFHVVR